ncbi:MAG: hypothetical protein ACLPUO_04935, partial [Streptosporangiaceae bacterium]
QNMTTADRLILAQIAAVARRYARTRIRSDEERAEAVAKLTEVAGGRSDLLAEHAGLSLGLGQVSLEILAYQYEMAAELCILAGADESLIPQWIAEGRNRAETARLVPYSSGAVGRPSRRGA